MRRPGCLLHAFFIRHMAHGESGTATASLTSGADSAIVEIKSDGLCGTKNGEAIPGI